MIGADNVNEPFFFLFFSLLPTFFVHYLYIVFGTLFFSDPQFKPGTNQQYSDPAIMSARMVSMPEYHSTQTHPPPGLSYPQDMIGVPQMNMMGTSSTHGE